MRFIIGSSLYMAMCQIPNHGGYLRGDTNHKTEHSHWKCCTLATSYVAILTNTSAWITGKDMLNSPAVGIRGVCTAVRMSSMAAKPQIIPTASRTLCHVRGWLPVPGDPSSHLTNMVLGWSGHFCSWKIVSNTNGWTSSANPRSYHLGATRGTRKQTTSLRIGWLLSDVTTAPAGDNHREWNAAWNSQTCKLRNTWQITCSRTG